VVVDTCTPAPPSGDQCREGRDANGNPCRMCVDATGAVVVDTCAVPPSPPAPGPIDRCDVREDPATGVACRICYDAAGVLVHDGCNPPPQPRCETVVYEGGLTCTICYDTSGTAISRTCASRS
jgi:hypothetical protein